MKINAVLPSMILAYAMPKHRQHSTIFLYQARRKWWRPKMCAKESWPCKARLKSWKNPEVLLWSQLCRARYYQPIHWLMKMLQTSCQSQDRLHKLGYVCWQIFALIHSLSASWGMRQLWIKVRRVRIWKALEKWWKRRGQKPVVHVEEPQRTKVWMKVASSTTKRMHWKRIAKWQKTVAWA